ncbi:MAG: ATP-binding cassette domain-containing protein [Alphaproteobacteria bacterium]|nr:ATP-binding cassette domain-containing protein [Alphaproteobacteria bacterium]
MTALSIHDIVVRAGDATLVDGASLAVARGELVALIGANGSGKTTLARAALGLIKTERGTSSLSGQTVTAMTPSERARACAYLPQSRTTAWPIRVRDAVALGRFAYGANIARLRGADADAVTRAIAACDLGRMAERSVDTLSGGEGARVHIARALASEAPALIADEPTAALDPLHAWTTMRLIADFVERGGAALVVLHDLTLAARFASRIAVMKSGRILIDAAPAEALSAETLRAAFGVESEAISAGGVAAPVVTGPARG